MAAEPLKAISVKHDAIMDFMISQPTVRLGDVAKHFGVTQAWLSTIIHSDLFEVALAKKKDVCFSATVLPLRNKLLGIAHIGVEKISDFVSEADMLNPIERQYTTDVTDNILKNLGYSPAAETTPSNVQNNYYSVDSDTLEKARGSMRQIRGETIENETDETKRLGKDVKPTEAL